MRTLKERAAAWLGFDTLVTAVGNLTEAVESLRLSLTDVINIQSDMVTVILGTEDKADALSDSVAVLDRRIEQAEQNALHYATDPKNWRADMVNLLNLMANYLTKQAGKMSEGMFIW